MQNTQKKACLTCGSLKCPTEGDALEVHLHIERMRMMVEQRERGVVKAKPQAADPDWESGIRPVGEELRKLRKARAR